MAIVYQQQGDNIIRLDSAHTPDYIGKSECVINPEKLPDLAMVKIEKGRFVTLSEDELLERAKVEEQVLKEAKLVQLKADRDQKIEDGYVFKEHTFWIDKGSQGDILVAMLMAQQNSDYATDWKTKDGWIHLTNAEIQQLAMEVFAYVGSLFQKERDETEKIAPEKIEVEVITLTTEKLSKI